MIAPPSGPDVNRYTAHYEWLRAQVLGTASRPELPSSPGMGLALLLRSGMPGWLNAIEAALCTAPTAPISTRATLGRLTVASGPRRELTILWASLVLSTRRLYGLSPTEGY